MNAIQFIKDHGVEKAREVVEGAPENSVYYRDMDSVCSPNEVLYYAWFGGALLVKDEEKGWTKSIYHTGEEYILDQLEKIDDLKRLVESVELIKKHGGLFSVKFGWYGENGEYGLTDLEDLEQAITDYESIYSGADQ
ncbi:hypothetical protein QLH32_04750 [Acinetobacter corruptisaponis]|uniref:Uncharacterized protein n=1 Tax=Acinetobacter corruptisaponis TaxID=3045147 RepID=A0ABY8S756_9GAMM|nr:hypothetical protein [Acinetobacter sp. KCTC 92772]WHP06784.1 hypothetical protein QLH32_04750 [Acinetobacter sp. KCTC 92772]